MPTRPKPQAGRPVIEFQRPEASAAQTANYYVVFTTGYACSNYWVFSSEKYTTDASIARGKSGRAAGRPKLI